MEVQVNTTVDIGPDETTDQVVEPAVIEVPLSPHADQNDCMFPSKCKWPTCSC
jgi:hypothetical protein